MGHHFYWSSEQFGEPRKVWGAGAASWAPLLRLSRGMCVRCQFVTASTEFRLASGSGSTLLAQRQFDISVLSSRQYPHPIRALGLAT